MARITFGVGAVLAVALSASAALAAGETVRVDRATCAKLVDHAPSADVAYRPGVDTRGKKVASADLDGGDQAAPLQLPQTYETNIAMNPMDKISATKYANSTMSAGKVGYDTATGQVSYNGQPLGNPKTAALVKACREAGFR
ncbi:MAG: hypothetical protein HQL33_08730 [Alphaproteobacteria bacterium]|nr:hypothetical protein [Alphaproteobacteria bacterium]